MGEERCLCIEAIRENKTEKMTPFLELQGEKKRTFLIPRGWLWGISSESPNFSDFRDPGVVEHCSRRPPGWPRRRWTGDGTRHTVIRFPGSRGCWGGTWQDGHYAPGCPDTKGCGRRGSWPLWRMGSLGGSCPSAGQQIPPGWGDGTSSSVHWCRPQG